VQYALVSPLEMGGTPRVTPHGYFAAPRAGPPIHRHQGVDLAAPPGSRVLAVGDGKIVRTDPGLGKIVRKLQLDVPGR
jgi:murein DD-endopeptidase MepM/ murein hydrolase activator NlpD